MGATLRATDPSDTTEYVFFVDCTAGFFEKSCDELWTPGGRMPAFDLRGTEVGTKIRVAGNLIRRENKEEKTWKEFEHPTLLTPAFEEGDPRKDSPFVYIFRVRRKLGLLQLPTIVVDESRVAYLQAGEYLAVPLEPGAHRVRVQLEPQGGMHSVPGEVAITVQPKTPAYVRVKFQGFGGSAQWQVEAAAEQESLEEIKSYRPLRPVASSIPAWRAWNCLPGMVDSSPRHDRHVSPAQPNSQPAILTLRDPRAHGARSGRRPLPS